MCIRDRYIREKYPDLIPLYEEIYNKKRLEYWQALEQDLSLIHIFRTSRRYVLNIYTCNNAYADIFQTDFG